VVAAVRGVKRAQFALAWLRSKPAVTAALVGASTVGQIDDAIASLVLVIDLRSDEIRLLEGHYAPRCKPSWSGCPSSLRLAWPGAA
jgi:aryl-alcohol dehydrogenase-like predicted oxidoreductase